MIFWHLFKTQINDIIRFLNLKDRKDNETKAPKMASLQV